jgi:AcrR family transcriptional regulator
MKHFAEHGYQGARIEDMAADLGIAKGSIFQHFGSKAGLFLETYKRAVASLPGWLDAPDASLTAQSYGSQLLWEYLDERVPGLLPAYLSRVAGGAGALRLLDTTYATTTHRRFAPAFGQFAAWAAGRYADRIRPLRTLARGARLANRVAPLAIHYIRLPRGARSVSLRFTRGHGQAALVYQLDSLRAGEQPVTGRLTARMEDGCLRYSIPARLRRSGRLATPTLVVANGLTTGSVRYSAILHGTIVLPAKVYAAAIVLAMLALAYFMLFEYIFGQTIGMMIFNIQAENVTLWRAFVRNAYLLPVFPFPILWIIEPLHLLFLKTRFLERLSNTRTIERIYY